VAFFRVNFSFYQIKVCACVRACVCACALLNEAVYCEDRVTSVIDEWMDELMIEYGALVEYY